MEYIPSGSLVGTADKDGLSPGWLAIAFVVLLLLVFSRRPQDLLHAQFYAEDGTLWFTQAYNMGWLHSLAIPCAGYFQTLPRLPVAIALLLPLAWAPLVLNLVGAALQVLPAVVLLSNRCVYWGPLGLRAVMAAIFIANPNAPEVHVNVTNAQWHFALLELFLSLAPTPRSWLGKAATLLVVLVGTLSGPFPAALFVVLLIFWFVERRRWTLVLIVLFGLGTLRQAQTFMSATEATDPVQSRVVLEHVPLGASPSLLARILGQNIVLNSVTGINSPRVLHHVPLVGALLLCVVGVFALTIAIRRGPLEFRLFVVFTLILLVASLRSPLISGNGPRWQLLLYDCGARYYLFPSLAFLWAIVYSAWRNPSPIVQKLAMATMVLFVMGVLRRWEYQPFPDLHYQAELQRLESAPKGQLVKIPIVPVTWSMSLVKR